MKEFSSIKSSVESAEWCIETNNNALEWLARLHIDKIPGNNQVLIALMALGITENDLNVLRDIAKHKNLMELINIAVSRAVWWRYARLPDNLITVIREILFSENSDLATLVNVKPKHAEYKLANVAHIEQFCAQFKPPFVYDIKTNNCVSFVDQFLGGLSMIESNARFSAGSVSVSCELNGLPYVHQLAIIPTDDMRLMMFDAVGNKLYEFGDDIGPYKKCYGFWGWL